MALFLDSSHLYEAFVRIGTVTVCWNHLYKRQTESSTFLFPSSPRSFETRINGLLILINKTKSSLLNPFSKDNMAQSNTEPNLARISRALVRGLSDADAYRALVRANMYIPYNINDLGMYENGEEGWNLENPPSILGRLEPPSWYAQGQRPDGAVHNLRNQKDKLVRGTFGGFIRSVKLPLYIKAHVDPVVLEAWFRMDSSTTYSDIRNRQHEDAVPYYNGKRDTALANNSCSYARQHEARIPLGILVWTSNTNRRRGHVRRSTIEQLGEVTEEQIALNTNWVVTPGGIHPPTNPYKLYPRDYFLGRGRRHPHRASEYLTEILECRWRLRKAAALHNVDHWRQLSPDFLFTFFSRQVPGSIPQSLAPTYPLIATPSTYQAGSSSSNPIDLDGMYSDPAVLYNYENMVLDPVLVEFDDMIANSGALDNPNNMWLDPAMQDWNPSTIAPAFPEHDFAPGELDALLGLTDPPLNDFTAALGLINPDQNDIGTFFSEADMAYAMELATIEMNRQLAEYPAGDQDTFAQMDNPEVCTPAFAESNQHFDDNALIGMIQDDWITQGESLQPDELELFQQALSPAEEEYVATRNALFDAFLSGD